MLRPTYITDFAEIDSISDQNYNARFFYYFNNSTLNNVFGDDSGVIFVFAFGSASILQMVITKNGDVYIRSRYSDSNWGDWSKVGA